MKAVMLTIAMSLVLGPVCYAADAAPKAVPAAQEVKKSAIKTIFDYSKELGLSAKQEVDIKNLLTTLQQKLTTKAEEMSTLRKDLAEMIRDKKALPMIKKQLQKVASAQADNSYLDIETSRKVEDILTADQLAKWKEIQKKMRDEAKAKMVKDAEKAPAKK